MVTRHLSRCIALLAGAAVAFIFFTEPLLAQDAGSETLEQERAITTIPEEGEEEIEEIPVSEDITPVGVVDEIVLTGQVVTSRGAVLRQMTFGVGDEISRRDIGLSRRRLLGFNGIYWLADITWEPAEEEGHITVTVDLEARRTWFLSPSVAGGVIGDRNAFGTGDTISLGIFIADVDYYYTVGWTDPQWLGGHNSMYIEGHILDTSNSIRTDTLYTTGETYYLDRNGFSLNYRTRWHETTSVMLGYRWEDVAALKWSDPFANLGDDDHFYFSGAEIPDGRVGVLSFGLAAGSLNSRFFPTRGYYWFWNNEFARSITGSDFDFTRHALIAAAFTDLYRGRNALCGRMMYSHLTGDPPDYELIPFDWQVRGYSGGTHRGKSMLVFNFEYRFIAEPDIFQGILFADFGRSWDGHDFSLNGLEYGYGAGIRIHTAPFVPYNLLLRIDYGFGADGQELTFGFNQFF